MVYRGSRIIYELPIAEKKIFQNIKITTKFFPLEPEPIQKRYHEIIYSSLKQNGR